MLGPMAGEIKSSGVLFRERVAGFISTLEVDGVDESPTFPKMVYMQKLMLCTAFHTC